MYVVHVLACMCTRACMLQHIYMHLNGLLNMIQKKKTMKMLCEYISFMSIYTYTYACMACTRNTHTFLRTYIHVWCILVLYMCNARVTLFATRAQTYDMTQEGQNLLLMTLYTLIRARVKSSYSEHYIH